jgi:hypothetical protein
LDFDFEMARRVNQDFDAPVDVSWPTETTGLKSGPAYVNKAVHRNQSHSNVTF